MTKLVSSHEAAHERSEFVDPKTDNMGTRWINGEAGWLRTTFVQIFVYIFRLLHEKIRSGQAKGHKIFNKLSSYPAQPLNSRTSFKLSLILYHQYWHGLSTRQPVGNNRPVHPDPGPFNHRPVRATEKNSQPGYR